MLNNETPFRGDLMGSLDDVLTFKEAATLWGMDDSNLRHAIRKGKFTEEEVRKSGATWLITKKAMERVYGKREEV